MSHPNLIQVIILSVIQGAAELLPVSSSAHVIVAEHLMGLDPTSPAMTFLLVMLHLGTMFAVLCYFWPRWRARLVASGPSRRRFIVSLIIATLCTGAIGLLLKSLIEKVILHGTPGAEVELLFGNLPLIAASLFAVGILILVAGSLGREKSEGQTDGASASVIGVVQGLCLPFRGFSRSGATISSALLLGIDRELAEEFSFALAVLLTPPVIVRESVRLLHASRASESVAFGVVPGLIGMVTGFFAGLVALRWLSSWIEKGRWSLFGYYCFAASAAVVAVYWFG